MRFFSLRSAWKRSYPELPVDHLPVLGLLEEVAASVRGATDRILHDSGLTHGEFDVLAALCREDDGRGMTQTELASVTMVTPAGAAIRLSRLEKEGWIGKTPGHRDRRTTLVALTDEGRTKLGEVAPRFFATESAIFSGLDTDDLGALVRILNKLESAARATPGAGDTTSGAGTPGVRD